jgi:anaerobic selenocysteine-containing dehydrogenase
MPRAPLVLREFASNPDKLLAVIDPRKSETAKIANLHIALRPGTDALLVKAMIAIILKEKWEKRDYLASACIGFEKIEPWFTSFDIPSALSVCEVSYDEVHALCRELATRRWCFHADLGTLMNRHSTVVSYLHMLLAAVCGRLCVAGGDVIPGTVMPIGANSDERDPKTWRTVATNFPAIMGTFPPNVLPEEILSGRDDRPRAVIVSGANPLRSYADTTAYEEAFGKLDLLVTMEIAMTETAALSHYVLPARSGYESWDSTFFAWNYPDVFFHMRPPVVKAEGERLECGQIYTRLARGIGIVPEIPAFLNEAAEKDIYSFTLALFAFMRKNPKAMKVMPFVLAETLGRRDDSANKAALWGLLLSMPGAARRNAARAGLPSPSAWSILARPGRVARAVGAAVRYGSVAPLMALHPNILQSEMIYNQLLEHPEGIWIGRLDPEANMKELRTQDRKIHLHIPEMEEPLKAIAPESERAALTPDSQYPFILNAGRHTRNVANTLMRDPAWLKGKRGCTLAIHPDDAAALGIGDGETVRVTTQAGTAQIGAELSADVRKGQVLIPHGFGLVHRGTAYGVNVNYLTKNTHRDFLAATPLHRYVPCRVERIEGERP